MDIEDKSYEEGLSSMQHIPSAPHSTCTKKIGNLYNDPHDIPNCIASNKVRNTNNTTTTPSDSNHRYKIILRGIPILRTDNWASRKKKKKKRLRSRCFSTNVNPKYIGVVARETPIINLYLPVVSAGICRYTVIYGPQIPGGPHNRVPLASFQILEPGDASPSLASSVEKNLGERRRYCTSTLYGRSDSVENVSFRSFLLFLRFITFSFFKKSKNSVQNLVFVVIDLFIYSILEFLIPSIT
ncbi:hypothetical protein Cni_G01663 [Canna indica]|uniref:Uncharacterized protein n=1 Tax=Canna indica TaxID=4628 RepID=A0AAQ3JNL8_9LILI|nr:hypothetical protein Cni_G01663 [Canna indica]